MKWNRKYIAVFSVMFFVLAAVLLVKGWQMPKGGTVLRRGTEEAIVTPVLTGSFIQGNEAEEKAADRNSAVRSGGTKQQEKNTSEKNEKKSKVVKPDKTDTKKKSSGTSVPEQTGEKNSGKKKIAGGKKSSTPAAEPTAAPSIPGADGGNDETEKTEPARWLSFQIDCINILNQKDLWREGIEEIIPVDGIFYKGTLSFTDGESAYELLKRICRDNKIALDSQYTPLFGTYYVKGIGNLYEFDCGEESGWKYSVNGVLPGTGSSGYLVKSGDKLRFYYDYRY